MLTFAAFAASDIDNPGDVWPGAFGVFLFGMLQCWTLLRTGDLWFAVGLHNAWNFGESFVYLAPDSGYRLQEHLLSSSLQVPRWTTGSFGPESSVFAIVVVAVLIYS